MNKKQRLRRADIVIGIIVITGLLIAILDS